MANKFPWYFCGKKYLILDEMHENLDIFIPKNLFVLGIRENGFQKPKKFGDDDGKSSIIFIRSKLIMSSRKIYYIGNAKKISLGRQKNLGRTTGYFQEYLWEQNLNLPEIKPNDKAGIKQGCF